jgi:flagellar biosynthesis chaperone FliJ
MKNAYETQLIQLEELIIQQRKQVQALKIALDDTEQRFVLVKKKNKFIFFRINEFYFSWLKNLKMKKKKKFDYKYFKIN